MVNGAGLAMATMDIIGSMVPSLPTSLFGGGATTEKVTPRSRSSPPIPMSKVFWSISLAASCAVMSSPRVVAAARDVGLKVSLVVRLEGTRVEEGKAILSSSGLDLIAADDLDDAAQKIVVGAGVSHVNSD